MTSRGSLQAQQTAPTLSFKGEASKCRLRLNIEKQVRRAFQDLGVVTIGVLLLERYGPLTPSLNCMAMSADAMHCPTAVSRTNQTAIMLLWSRLIRPLLEPFETVPLCWLAWRCDQTMKGIELMRDQTRKTTHHRRAICNLFQLMG
jgi:hypothetical protein